VSAQRFPPLLFVLSLPVCSANELITAASLLPLAISAQSMTKWGLSPSVKDILSWHWEMTYFFWSFRTRVTRLTFPLPGGPVTVMKVLGCSESHRLMSFSAS
jgi:hypothetical protein